MARRGRKMNLAMPSKAEAYVMSCHGTRLTDQPPLPGYLAAQYTRHSNKPKNS